MELAFETTQYPFLRPVIREIRTQEETMETIVPDSDPDIAFIVHSYAAAIIRGKDCREGSVTLSGGIKGGILYTPEDGSGPKVLDFYLPFTVKAEHPDLSQHAQVLCSAAVRSVDGRMINSRKAMLRVNLACCILAYETAALPLYRLSDCPDYLQLKRSTYDVELPQETAEKSFVVSETITVPNGRPPMRQVYKLICRPEVTDQKLIGNKAVFKGRIWCKLLYLTPDQTLSVYEQQLPFSQFSPLQAEYDQERLSVLPVITGYDLEPEDGSESRSCQLTIHCLAQCTVYGACSLELMEDAYATSGLLEPQWYTYELEGCLDHQTSLQTVRQHLTGQLREILDSDVYLDYPTVQCVGDLAKVTAPISVQVLGYDANGGLSCLSESFQPGLELALHTGSHCISSITMTNPPDLVPVSDGAELRLELAVETACSGVQPLQTLSAASWSEAEVSRPSVILRKVPGDTALWDIAKACSAREAAIREANHLEGEWLAEESLLLIPVG